MISETNKNRSSAIKNRTYYKFYMVICSDEDKFDCSGLSLNIHSEVPEVIVYLLCRFQFLNFYKVFSLILRFSAIFAQQKYCQKWQAT